MDAEAFDHTPLPWRISDDEKSIVCAYYHDEEPEVCRRPQKSWRGGWDADAELICRAVNSHSRLVAALEVLVAEIESSDTNWGISSSLLVGAYVTRDQLAEARAALALARGEVE